MKPTWSIEIASIAILSCIINAPVSAQPPDFSICEGLTGAAWGLCRGGVAAGCADGTGSLTSCAIIEENFRSVTGNDPPWITPPVTCPCDYATDVPIDTAWDTVTQAVFSCPGDEASFAAVLPLPQFPQATAIRTTTGEQICQAVTTSGGNVRGDLPDDVFAACRADVVDYGLAVMVANPTLPVNDVCSPTLP
jgi:hypothetical protein